MHDHADALAVAKRLAKILEASRVGVRVPKRASCLSHWALNQAVSAIMHAGLSISTNERRLAVLFARVCQCSPGSSRPRGARRAMVLDVVAPTDVRSAGVIEHDGMFWKPRRGSTASAQEFIAARTLFIELNQDAVWNPWIRDEREAELDEAAEIMSQWQRAEPGHRHLGTKQWEARQARRERQREQQRVKDAARRERDMARYDEPRSTARLRLIEVQASVECGLAELVGFRDGTKFPAMDPGRRVAMIRGVGAEDRASGRRDRTTDGDRRRSRGCCR